MTRAQDEPKVLFANIRRQSNFSFTYQGNPFYESADPAVKNKNPTSHVGLASAVHADFINICHVDYRSAQFIEQYDVIIVLPTGPSDIHLFLDWIKTVKSTLPSVVVGLGFDGTVLTHKILCRNWEFQKAFYLAAQLSDFVCADGGGPGVVEYFELFHSRSESLPWAVPVEYIQNTVHCFKSREQKQKILRQGGYMMGRIGSDGYAHVVPLIEAQKKNPEFKIQVLSSHKNIHQIMAAVDWTEIDQRWFRGPFQKTMKWISRASARADRFLGKEEDLSVAPLLLRGVFPEAIISKPLPDWKTNLRDWGDAYLAIDMDTSFNGGRAAIDAALSGTPMIGCNASFQRALFPDLCVEDGAYRKAGELVSRLISDSQFYDSVVLKARQSLMDYDEQNSLKRFRAIIEPYLKRNKNEPRR